MRGALGEDGFQICGSVKADDSLHVAALLQMIADRSLQFPVTIGNTDEGREMSTGGGSDDDDLAGLDSENRLLRPQEIESPP